MAEQLHDDYESFSDFLTPNEQVQLSIAKKWEGRYRSIKPQEYRVDEVGRYMHQLHHTPVNMDTWSNASGEPIPESCKVPIVQPPVAKQLPLSLKMSNWCYDDRLMCLDVTNPVNREYCFRPDLSKSELPEFIPEYFSSGKILTWALREGYNLSSIDCIIPGSALRAMSTTSLSSNAKWSFAVCYYQNTVFIDDHSPGFDPASNYWKASCPFDSSINLWLLPPVDNIKFFPRPNMLLMQSMDDPLPETYTNFLGCCGKKFEDIMHTGGLGNNDYRGKNIDVRSIKFVKFRDHKILTVTRNTCQERDKKLIDKNENYVELKTMYPNRENWFARHKSLQLWVHCYLIGVHHVYCGFRHKNGVLVEIRKYSMDDLEKIGCRYWSPSEPLSCLERILTWLKRKLAQVSVRKKDGEEWLKCDPNVPETFTLFSDGSGRVKLCKKEDRELKKIISERYQAKPDPIKHQVSVDKNIADEVDAVIVGVQRLGFSNKNHNKHPIIINNTLDDCEGSDNDENIPDNWDDSD